VTNGTAARLVIAFADQLIRPTMQIGYYKTTEHNTDLATRAKLSHAVYST